MDSSLLSTHLSWQGVVVLGLLFSSVILAYFIQSFPKDLIFTFAALFNALFGIVSSIELYHAAVNQVIQAVLGLWMFGKAFEQHRLFDPIISWLIHIKKERFTVPVRRKGWIALFLLCIAICATFFTAAIGTVFLIAGLLSLLVRPFSIKKAFCEEFPLPLLLAIFSAAIFLIAIQNSGLSEWAFSRI